MSITIVNLQSIVNDKGNRFTTGVNDAADKLMTGFNNTRDKKNELKYLGPFQNKFLMDVAQQSGTEGKLNHEKTMRKKIGDLVTLRVP